MFDVDQRSASFPTCRPVGRRPSDWRRSAKKKGRPATSQPFASG